MAASIGIIGALLLPASLIAHEQCNICHISQTPTAQQATLAGSLPALCVDCHYERMGKSEHVINIFPTGPTGNLPLINGRLGCTTCHDPHGKTAMQLRTSTDKLCMSCHPR